jgi:hypothetical protein
MRKAFLYLLLVQLLDYATTAYLVLKQGYDVEANPVLLHLMKTNDSPFAIFFFKILVFGIYAAAMYTLYRCRPDRFQIPLWRWVVYFFNIAYTVVVLRTIYIILAQ